MGQAGQSYYYSYTDLEGVGFLWVDGVRYPVRWHLTIPGHDVDATVAATFPEQEMTIELGPIYWEGSVTVEGSVGGVGFVEMTGYAP